MPEIRIKNGLLLVGHGTRNEVGTRQFLALAERIRQRTGGGLLVEPAFLELQQPDIDFAVGRLVDQGIDRLLTVPLLLFAAGHAKEDVPAAAAMALADRGRNNVTCGQAGHLGCHPAMVELSKLREGEAFNVAQRGGASRYCGPREDPGTESACLLLVGRGSRDESATAEMYEFARLRQRARQEPRAPENEKVEVGFLAMAQPLLAEKLPEIARRGYRRVVVQPHLLFHGELVDSIERQVADARSRFPETEWITTQPLADLPGETSQATELIEKVILDRCQEAGIHVVATGVDD